MLPNETVTLAFVNYDEGGNHRANPVPEPTTAALLLVGIAGLAFVNRQSRRR